MQVIQNRIHTFQVLKNEMKKKYSIAVMTVILLLLFSCKSKIETTNSEETTVLVQMYDANSLEMLIQDFDAYNLQKQKLVSRPLHIFLFSFNSEKITATELIDLLKASDLVKEAQTNKNVELRN